MLLVHAVSTWNEMSYKAFFFGALRIQRGDVTLKLPASIQARSLLAYLLVQKKKPQSRLALAGEFCPEKQEVLALRALSQALWQIRNILPELVESDRQFVWVRDVPIWMDVEDFETSIKIETLSSLLRAIDLYRGGFLEGFYDDWALDMRERLREEYLNALDRVVILEKKRGRYDEALAYAKRLVHEEPHREETHCELMRLYLALEQPAAALKQFQTCRQVLRAELKTEPDEKTLNLAAEISRHVSAASTDTWQEGSDSLPEAVRDVFWRKPSLVGREAERKILLDGAGRVFDGEGLVILVEGEAGVGKTRLMEEISGDIQWRGGQVLRGGGREMEVLPPFGPLIEALRSALSPLRARQLSQVVEKTWLEVLAPLLPELAAILPEHLPVPPLNYDQEQVRLLEAFVCFLKAWGKITPLVMILEDLHWFDRDTVNLLPALASRVDEMGVLLVVTYRGEEARAYPPLLEKLQAIDTAGKSQRLILARLNATATSELIRQFLGIKREALIFASRLYRETEGNPLFVLETLRALHDEGLLSRDKNGDWSTPWDETTVDYAELPLPTAVERVIARRIDRLLPETRSVLEAAAILGYEVEFSLLQSLGGRDSTALMEALGILGQRQFITEAAENYQFTHEKIRQVTYQSIRPEERKQMHKKAAQMLESGFPERVNSLAFQFFNAEEWEKAADYNQRAGEQAWRIYANAESLDHFHKALDALLQLTGALDYRRVYAIRLACEKVYDLMGEREAQTRELEALASLAESLNDDRLRAEIALRRARQAELTCDFPAAIIAADRAVQLANAAQDVTIEIESRIEWGWTLLMQGNHAGARQQFVQANDLARPASLLRLEADSLHGLGTISLVTGEYNEAKARFKHVLEICKRIDIRPREASTYANLGYIATAQGDHAIGMVHNEQALRIYREIGDQRGAALVMENISDEYLAEGNFSAAKNYLEQALTIQKVIHARDNYGMTLCGLGRLYHHLGDYQHAKAYYEQAQVIFNETGIPYYQGQILSYLSLLSHHLGDQQTAREQSRQGLEIARQIDDRLGQGWLLDTLGHALAALGEWHQAEEAYQQALALRREMDEPHLRAESLAGLARLALAGGDMPAALERVEELLKVHETRGFGGAKEPFRIYLTCYQVLEAAEDSRAVGIINTACTCLMAQRACIWDETLKRSFLEDVAVNREILLAFGKTRGEKVIAHLPRFEIPTGRPLRPDEWVEVSWTPRAPEDETIKGKTERRQHRLHRLLDEAHSQGAAPTVADLSAALEVSPATIKRDLAVLRESGAQILTRGSRGRSK